MVSAIVNMFKWMLGLGFLGLFLFLTMSGTTRISGRVMTLIDPSYASSHMPLIASVAEHASTKWWGYYNELAMLLLFVPLGLYYSLVHKITHGKLFVAMYCVFATYFSCVMTRLMLILAPAACILAAIGVSHIWGKAAKAIRLAIIGKKVAEDAPIQPKRRLTVELAFSVIVVSFLILKLYIYHSMESAAFAFSNPVFVSDWGRKPDGSRIINDEFRESYYWLKQNTDPDSKIMAWWDYGYQIAGMSNRTVIVDNNTWNNTHIATVGKALISDEETGYQIARSLDAKYVLVYFGGGQSMNTGDDMGKFLWFVRIAASVFPGIVEETYYNEQDYSFEVDKPSKKLRESLTYKFLYYRFGEMQIYRGYPAGYDYARGLEIGHKKFDLKYFREVYTSKTWAVRIYEVLDPENRANPYSNGQWDHRRLLTPEKQEYSAESGYQNSGGDIYGK